MATAMGVVNGFLFGIGFIVACAVMRVLFHMGIS